VVFSRRASAEKDGRPEKKPIDFVLPSVAKACVIACLVLELLSGCERLSLSPRAAVAANEYPGKEAAISPIGRCSGSAMVCEAPAMESSTLDQVQRRMGAKDDEHALLQEAIATIDRRYYDIKNAEGASASSQAHTYNGMAVDQLRTALDARKLTSREATYKEIRKIVKGLGDKYARFIPPTEAASLTKYDVSSIGLVLIRQDGALIVAADAYPRSAAAAAGIKRGDRVLSIITANAPPGKAKELSLHSLSANDAALALASEARMGSFDLRLQRPSRASAPASAASDDVLDVTVQIPATAQKRDGGVPWLEWRQNAGKSLRTVSAEVLAMEEGRAGGGGGGKGEVIKIREFAATTAREVEEALLLCDNEAVLGDERTEGKGGGGEMDGERVRDGEGARGCRFVALDLRGNRGGLLEGAVRLICCRVRASEREGGREKWRGAER